ncbi:MAG: ribonuclease P protein component [Rickettsiales bacterium]
MALAPSIPLTTLKNRADFLRLRRGRKFVSPFFILRYAPSNVPNPGARVGYTVTTKCGNAVVRNRIKRRLRALVRELFPGLASAGYDYIFIALEKSQVEHVPFDLLRTTMREALDYAGKHP